MTRTWSDNKSGLIHILESSTEATSAISYIVDLSGNFNLSQESTAIQLRGMTWTNNLKNNLAAFEIPSEEPPTSKTVETLSSNDTYDYSSDGVAGALAFNILMNTDVMQYGGTIRSFDDYIKLYQMFKFDPYAKTLVIGDPLAATPVFYSFQVQMTSMTASLRPGEGQDLQVTISLKVVDE